VIFNVFAYLHKSSTWLLGLCIGKRHNYELEALAAVQGIGAALLSSELCKRDAFVREVDSAG
jgi:hypothetical protein